MGNDVKKKQTDENEGETQFPDERQEEQRQEKAQAFVRKKLNLLKPPPPQLEEKVFDLSDIERMKEKYFRPVLRGMNKAVVEVANEKKAYAHGIRNQKEKKACIERLDAEIGNVQSVEVRLVLCELNGEIWQNLASAMQRFVTYFDYGPHHAALVIGGVVLEWDNSSLVIPRPLTKEDGWIFDRSVHLPVESSEKYLKDLPVRAEAANTGQHFDTIVEKITGIKMEKEQLVHELVDVAVRYNTKHTYGVFSHNCQHFVRDCLHVLGIRDMEEVYNERLKILETILDKEGLRGSKCEEFDSHQDLDDYVRENLQNMNKAELDLCMCHYLFFHALHEALPKEAERYQCDACLQSQVERKLELSKQSGLK